MRAAAMRIEKSVGKLFGKPCWGVKPGFGSFLTLEFGSPHLHIREPIAAKKSSSTKVRSALARRAVHIHGEWHLWIYCCDWQVFSGGKRIGDSSSKAGILRAAELLDGPALTGFGLSSKSANCVFKFDLGATLKTQPRGDEGGQWLLFEPSHKVLVMLADGLCKHKRSGEHWDQ